MSQTDQLTQRLLGRFDVPAYVRRGLRVAQRRAALTAHCRKKRLELLYHVRWRADQVRHAVSRPEEFERHVPLPTERDQWRALWDVLEISGDRAGGAAVSPRRLRRMLRETHESLTRFNRVWQQYIGQLDLTPLNRELEAYNRYYLLEKECALRSARLARQGYRPFSPISTDDLLDQFPLLSVPPLAKHR
jgi:hypothetical protein